MGRGTGLLIAGTGCLFLFGFLSRVLIARYFPVADWGVFSLALALSGLLSIVCLLGLDQALARALSYERDPAVRWSIVRYGVGAAGLAAVAASAAVWVLSPELASAFHIGPMRWVLELFSVTIGFNLLSLVLASVFQGFEDALPNALFNQVVNPGLFVVFVAAAIGLHLGFPGVVGGYLAAAGLSFALLALYSLRGLERHRAGATGPAPARELWRLAGILWGVGTLAYITAYADTMILGLFRPAAEVGAYAALMVLGRVLLVSNGTLTYIYLPLSARLAREGDHATIRSTYLAGTRWVLLLITPGCLLLLLLPRLALATVFGPNYTGGATTLQVLVIPAFFAVLVGPSSACLAGTGEFRALLASTVAAAGVNLTLSFALVPGYGVLGAAIAWGVARVAYPGLGWAVLYRRFGVNPFTAPLLKPLLLGGALTVPLYAAAALAHPAAWALLPLYAGGAGLFLASLAITRSLGPGELAVADLAEGALGRPLPVLRRFLARCTSSPGLPVSVGPGEG